MKTIYNSKAAGKIIINSEYIGDKLIDKNAISFSTDDDTPNSHNHKITFELENSKSISLWFWGSNEKPKIETDAENIHVLYLFLKYAEHGKMSFEEFCEFRDNTVEVSRLNYMERQKYFEKYNEIFDSEIGELISEIETNNFNPTLIAWSNRMSVTF